MTRKQSSWQFGVNEEERIVRQNFLSATVSLRHIANEGRIAFQADSSSEVDRMAETAVLLVGHFAS